MDGIGKIKVTTQRTQPITDPAQDTRITMIQPALINPNEPSTTMSSGLNADPNSALPIPTYTQPLASTDLLSAEPLNLPSVPNDNMQLHPIPMSPKRGIKMFHRTHNI